MKKEMKLEKKKKKKIKKLEERRASLLVDLMPPPAPPQPVGTTPQPFLELWQSDDCTEDHGPAMTDEQKARLSTKRPLTKEEYEAKQSVIRRVVDLETGRTRLIRGEGEIIEEIVSKERHKDINKQATKGDGNSFQKKLGLNR